MAGACEYGNETSGSIKYVELRLAENVLASQEGLCSICSQLQNYLAVVIKLP